MFTKGGCFCTCYFESDKLLFWKGRHIWSLGACQSADLSAPPNAGVSLMAGGGAYRVGLWLLPGCSRPQRMWHSSVCPGAMTSPARFWTYDCTGRRHGAYWRGLSRVHRVLLGQAVVAFCNESSRCKHSGERRAQSRRGLTCTLAPSCSELRVIFILLCVLLLKLNCCVPLSS